VIASATSHEAKIVTPMVVAKVNPDGSRFRNSSKTNTGPIAISANVVIHWRKCLGRVLDTMRPHLPRSQFGLLGSGRSRMPLSIAIIDDP
jgi:hypothetical protein